VFDSLIRHIAPNVKHDSAEDRVAVHQQCLYLNETSPSSDQRSRQSEVSLLTSRKVREI
jgi:hypothetical protein